MARTTSITIGQHFETLIDELVNGGSYNSTSEVVRAGLRLLEEKETEIRVIRRALIEGEESGLSNRTIDQIVAEEKEKRRANA